MIGLDQSVVDPFVIPLFVVMSGVFATHGLMKHTGDVSHVLEAAEGTD
jgi:hypothetical protein